MLKRLGAGNDRILADGKLSLYRQGSDQDCFGKGTEIS